MEDQKFLQYINSGVDGMIITQQPQQSVSGVSIQTTQAYTGLTKLEYFALSIYSRQNTTAQLALTEAKELLAVLFAEQLKQQKDATNLLHQA